MKQNCQTQRAVTRLTRPRCDMHSASGSVLLPVLPGVDRLAHRLALFAVAAPHPAARKYTSRSSQQRQRPREQTTLCLPGRSQVYFLCALATIRLCA